MTDDELPPLPECLTDPFRGTDYGVYSPQQMRDYGKACAAAAIEGLFFVPTFHVKERCAQVVEGPPGLDDSTALARIIRSLKGKP